MLTPCLDSRGTGTRSTRLYLNPPPRCHVPHTRVNQHTLDESSSFSMPLFLRIRQFYEECQGTIQTAFDFNLDFPYRLSSKKAARRCFPKEWQLERSWNSPLSHLKICIKLVRMGEYRQRKAVADCRWTRWKTVGKPEIWDKRIKQHSGVLEWKVLYEPLDPVCARI